MSSLKTDPAPAGKETQSGLVVNDLSIEMATANGTGSQSANNILAKTLFRMGIPVGAKNLFPSNIQGLPTWFTIRISKYGYTARKKELDWLVGMNVDTWVDDVEALQPGAVVLYNSDDLSAEPLENRGDLIVYPIPITSLIRDNVEAARLRKMLANVVYVGALAELLGFDWETLTSVIQDTFRSKPKAVDVNVKCAELGRDYVRDHLEKRDRFRVEKMQENEGKILVDGNTTAALGCLMAGCTVVGWYPITPSSSLCESLIDQFQRFRKDPATGEHRFAAVQCEDELASLGLVLGAGWAGARAMTSTSGPGISLMNEFVGFGYYAEVPGVIFDVQRVGPSTGLPTRTAQADLLSAHYCSHGDTQHPCLLPAHPAEAYELARVAFDVAERLQTPVFVLTDLDLGMNYWITEKVEYPTAGFDRGKVLHADDVEQLKNFGRYKDVDGDGIPYRTLPGNTDPRASYFTRGSGHDENAGYTESHEVYQRNLDRVKRKIDGSRAWLPAPEVDRVDGAKIGIIAYGTTDAAMREARDLLHKDGTKASYLRIRALPLHREVVSEFLREHERIYIVEQNRDGQMETILRAELKDGNLTDRLRSVLHYHGLPVDARSIRDGIQDQEQAGS